MPALLLKEGAKYARTLLKEVGFSDDTTERVVWLIEHFHNLDQVNTFDHQVLIEAEMLITLGEQNANEERLHKALNEVFKTETGIELLYTMFGL